MFIYKKRIKTIKNSIFYSLIKYKNEILGFGRRYYGFGDRTINKIKLDKNFNIIENCNITFRGEDPRCFIYKEKLYILDNWLNDMYLIDYDNKKYIKINISGKNLSFINHNNNLYFMHWIKPFILFKFNIETGKITKIVVDDDKKTYNYEYRGGTPGYKINDNEYYGFGHRTKQAWHSDPNTNHTIFKWIVNFQDEKPRIKIIDIKQPINSKKICDPTSVIEIDNKKYLITAETDRIWYCEQDYITNVYEIND